MSSVFSTFFEIGAAVGVSLLVTLVVPAMFIFKKFIRR